MKALSPPPKYDAVPADDHDKEDFEPLKLLNVKLEQSPGLSDMAKMLAQFAKLFTGKALELDNETERHVQIITKQHQDIKQKTKRLGTLDKDVEKYKNQRDEAREELKLMTEKAERYKAQRNELRDDVETLNDKLTFIKEYLDRQLTERQLIRRGQMCPVCCSRNHWTRSRKSFDNGHSVMAHCRAARDAEHMNFCSGNFPGQRR